MKTIYSLIMLAVCAFAVVSCDDDDPWYGSPDWGYNNGGGGNDNGGNGGQTSDELNSYELKLVGSYVSDDDASSVFYLVLNNDRTGSYTVVAGNQTKSEEFTWKATSNTLTVYYSDSYEQMSYSFTDTHLIVDGISLVVNNGGSSTSNSKLVAQWQGEIRDSFYYEAYGLVGDYYGTVCEFASNGDGAQLDYDTRTPAEDYSYVPFTWTIGDNDAIQITYVDDYLPAATVTQYQLTDDVFRGKIAYDTYSFTFSFAHIYAFDWTPYYAASTASAKTRSAVSSTSFSKIREGVQSGKAVTSGKFAAGKLMQK